MAEAAGLALGGVALVSLLSSCVEFLEYLENGKNWMKDFQLALTKMGLLKARLKQWSNSIGLTVDSFQSHILRERWPEESCAIATTLVGIKEILGSTSQMCRRYDNKNDKDAQRNDKEKQGGKAWESNISAITYYRSRCWPASSSSDTTVEVPHRMRTFRLKATWALQDKKRFERLINDFDFLLHNLERIGDRLHSTDPTMEDAKPAAPYPVDSVEAKKSRWMVSSRSSNPGFHMETRTSCAIATPRGATIIPSDQTQSHPAATGEDVRITDAAMPAQETRYHFGSRESGEHFYLNNESHGYSDIYEGDYYTGANPTGATSHNYIGQRSYGDSMIHQGNTDAAGRVLVMREKLKARAEEKAREGPSDNRGSQAKKV